MKKTVKCTGATAVGDNADLIGAIEDLIGELRDIEGDLEELTQRLSMFAARHQRHKQLLAEQQEVLPSSPHSLSTFPRYKRQPTSPSFSTNTESTVL
jgi:hypothetical protein